MTSRHTVDSITSDELDALYARLDRVRTAADRLADGTEAGFRAALAVREALAEPCEQHPTAPVIGGLCGGCTQYPADMVEPSSPAAEATATAPVRESYRVRELEQQVSDAVYERERAEAEVKRWLAFIERGITEHMRFGVLHPDGTTEQLPCADWCYACRVEKTEAAIARVRSMVGQLHADAAAARADSYETSALAIEGSARRITYALDGTEQPTTEVTEEEKTTRVFASLHRSAEADVTRIIALYEQWVQAGPPPLGTPIARWWDARLVELHDAILPSADQTTEK